MKEDKARKLLEARRNELAELLAISEDEIAPVALDQASVGRLSRIDAMQRQSMAQAQERSRRLELQRIETAMRRLDDGDYGWCDECGEAIAEKRLALDPSARLCITCQSMAER